jgi:hypothetical protein
MFRSLPRFDAVISIIGACAAGKRRKTGRQSISEIPPAHSLRPQPLSLSRVGGADAVLLRNLPLLVGARS